MPGLFIVSLDCEGKWGFADCITAHHDTYFTEANLLAAYRKLLALFARHEIPATFAFVMAFTLSDAERAALADRLRDVIVDGKNWLRYYRAAEANGRTEGWFCPLALDEVRAHSEHEVACHSFCHAPLAESSIARDDAARELDAASAVAALKGIELRTFVYPRNQIGHRELLRQHGFIGYREALPRVNGVLGQAHALASEFNVIARSQPPLENADGLCRIPAGYFFNWRYGVRAKIPPAVTRRRWAAILRDAADRGEVAHLWFHPHNIIDGPETFDVLEDVLRDAASLRAQNRLQFVTQKEYAERRICV
jgi:peptidoglycan/xylan/chitin deacetylase (PgdA/CDA1 family)